MGGMFVTDIREKKVTDEDPQNESDDEAIIIVKITEETELVITKKLGE